MRALGRRHDLRLPRQHLRTPLLRAVACAHETALVLDLAGELFTDLGRDFLLRRMAEEGLGSINFNTWKHEYIFHCNQLAWFTPGRMLATGARAHWPRAQPYIELAYRDLAESLDYAILPDGGYVEGPTYFPRVGRDGGLALYLYARAAAWISNSIFPAAMRRTAAFAALVASTTPEPMSSRSATPATELGQDTLAVMARPCRAAPGRHVPEGAGAHRRHARLAAGAGARCRILHAGTAATARTASNSRPVHRLPDLGWMASRRSAGTQVKLLILGNQAGAGHTHEDKGSFVLEFAGEIFRHGPGHLRLQAPAGGRAPELRAPQHAGALRLAGAPAPPCPLPPDVKPRRLGDAVASRPRSTPRPAGSPTTPAGCAPGIPPSQQRS